MRLNREERWVEFDAEVCAIEDAASGVPFYLEQAVCTWNTREHESIFATSAKPSTIHAGLLLLGAQPGSPGSWAERTDGQFVPINPTGDMVTIEVRFIRDSGVSESFELARFIQTIPIDKETESQIKWVFAGSRERVRRSGESSVLYEADLTGTVVGLSSFGTEVIAPTRFHSPDLATQPALWIADFSELPVAGTPAVIRVQLGSKG